MEVDLVQLDLLADTHWFVTEMNKAKAATAEFTSYLEPLQGALAKVAFNYAVARATEFAAELTNLMSITTRLSEAFGMDANFFDFAQAATTAADFDLTMRNVEAALGATAEEMTALRAAAVEMGAETQYSSGQAAEATLNYAKAGYDAADAMTALEPTLRLAAAGQLGIAEAADIATGVMSGMSIETGKLGQVVDILAAAANGSKADVREMGKSFEYVAATASMAGKDIIETSAALMILADANLRADKGGTALDAVLIRMAAPTRKAQDAMDSLGVSFRDAENNLRPLADVVDDLNSRLDSLGLADQSKYLNAMFGEQGARGMAVMLQRGGDSLRQYQTDLVNSAGAAQKFADAYKNSLAGKLEAAKSAVDNFRLSLGTALIPVIGYLADSLSWLADRYTAIIKGVEEVVSWFTKSASAAEENSVAAEQSGSAWSMLGEMLLEIALPIQTVIHLYESLIEVTSAVGGAVLMVLGPPIAMVRGLFEVFGMMIADVDHTLKAFGVDIGALLPAIHSWSDALFLASVAATVFLTILSNLIILNTIIGVGRMLITTLIAMVPAFRAASTAQGIFLAMSLNWKQLAVAIAGAVVVTAGVAYAFDSVEKTAASASKEVQEGMKDAKKAVDELHAAAKDPLQLHAETDDALKAMEDLRKSAADFNRQQFEAYLTHGMDEAGAFRTRHLARGGEEEDIAEGLQFAQWRKQAEEQAALEKDVSDLTKRLEEQAATFGMSAEEAEMYRLSLRGVAEDQLEAARAAVEQLRVLKEQQKARDDLEKRATQLKADLWTPMQKFEEEAARLFELAKEGLIDERTYQQATQKLLNDHGIGDDAEKNKKPPEIVGLDEFLRKMQESALKGTDDKEQKRLELQEQANTYMRQMASALDELKKAGIIWA